MYGAAEYVIMVSSRSMFQAWADERVWRLKVIALRFNLRQSHKLVRIQAALVSALYLVLCTLGALTHNHAIAGTDAQSENAVFCRQSGVALAAHFDRTPLLPTHCAYCDWQTSSVSPALPIEHQVIPVNFASIASSLLFNQTGAALARASSRAPPFS